MQQLNPKHTKNCCNQGGSWKHGEAVGDDRNRWKKSKTKINSHSSETLTSSTFLAFLLSIYIRASPLWPALGKTHIFIYHYSVVTSKRRKSPFGCWKLSLGEKIGLMAPGDLNYFQRRRFSEHVFFFLHTFTFFHTFPSALKLCVSMKLIFIFLVPKFFQALGDFPYIRSSHGVRDEIPLSELNFMGRNSDLFRQQAVNCDKTHKKSLTSVWHWNKKPKRKK